MGEKCELCRETSRLKQVGMRPTDRIDFPTSLPRWRSVVVGGATWRDFHEDPSPIRGATAASNARWS